MFLPRSWGLASGRQSDSTVLTTGQLSTVLTTGQLIFDSTGWWAKLWSSVASCDRLQQRRNSIVTTILPILHARRAEIAFSVWILKLDETCAFLKRQLISPLTPGCVSCWSSEQVRACWVPGGITLAAILLHPGRTI